MQLFGLKYNQVEENDYDFKLKIIIGAFTSLFIVYPFGLEQVMKLELKMFWLVNLLDSHIPGFNMVFVLGTWFVVPLECYIFGTTCFACELCATCLIHWMEKNLW